jgi:hypothetical protein
MKPKQIKAIRPYGTPKVSATQLLSGLLTELSRADAERLLRDMLVTVADHPSHPWAEKCVANWSTERLVDEIGPSALQLIQDSVEDAVELRETDTLEFRLRPRALDREAQKQGIQPVQYWNALLDSLRLEESEENRDRFFHELIKEEYDDDGWASVFDGDIMLARRGGS